MKAILARNHPLHQGAHSQLGGDGQGLVQQGHCLPTVAGVVTLEQGVGLIAAGPGQLGLIASFSAEASASWHMLGIAALYAGLMGVASKRGASGGIDVRKGL